MRQDRFFSIKEVSLILSAALLFLALSATVVGINVAGAHWFSLAIANLQPRLSSLY